MKCSLSPAVEVMGGMEGREAMVAWEALEDEGEMVQMDGPVTAPALAVVVMEVQEAMEEMGVMVGLEGQGEEGEMADMLALEENVLSKVSTLICWCWLRWTAGLALRGMVLLVAAVGQVALVALEGVEDLVGVVDMAAATATEMASATTTPMATEALLAAVDGMGTSV